MNTDDFFYGQQVGLGVGFLTASLVIMITVAVGLRPFEALPTLLVLGFVLGAEYALNERVKRKELLKGIYGAKK